MIFKDQLEAVYKLIEKPEHWTQEYFARTESGVGIGEDYDLSEEGLTLSDEEIAAHPDAACWCLFGAAYKCGISDDGAYGKALAFAVPYQIADFNDAHTHEEVLALLRSAIERAPVRP